jgi:hypothetical protein
MEATKTKEIKLWIIFGVILLAIVAGTVLLEIFS